MEVRALHKVARLVFSLFMVFSAVGELSRHEAVLRSMELLMMPDHLLYLLGTLKLLGVVAIWYSPCSWLKEWAYAGFAFDLLGAIFGFAATRQAVYPDIIMAPLGLTLCLTTYYLWRRTGCE